MTVGFPGDLGLEFVPGGVVNVLGALLVAAVGAGVLLVRPRTRKSVAFGVHLAAFGGAFALHNFGSREVPWINTALGLSTALLLVVGGLAMFRVAWLTRPSVNARPLLDAGGIAAIGMIFTAVGLTGLGGPIRMAGALLIAWGILRYQVLDIDVKLRWGLEQSTVASIFIAVFFIVSEGAQAAWRDGALTCDERVLLDHLRERLRIPVEDAAAMERQVLSHSPRPSS